MAAKHPAGSLVASLRGACSGFGTRILLHAEKSEQDRAVPFFALAPLSMWFTRRCRENDSRMQQLPGQREPGEVCGRNTAAQADRE